MQCHKHEIRKGTARKIWLLRFPVNFLWASLREYISLSLSPWHPRCTLGFEAIMGLAGTGTRKSRPTQALNLGFLALNWWALKVQRSEKFLETKNDSKRERLISLIFHKTRVNSESFTLNDRGKKEKKSPAFCDCVLYLHITTPGCEKQILDFKK